MSLWVLYGSRVIPLTLRVFPGLRAGFDRPLSGRGGWAFTILRSRVQHGLNSEMGFGDTALPMRSAWPVPGRL